MFRRISHSTLKSLILKRFQSTSAEVTEFYKFPVLSNISKYRETGIPGLFSAQGLQNAFYDRVELHLQNLNEELSKKSINSSYDLDFLVDELSKASNDLKVYNNASLINNISFALGSLGEVREADQSTPSKIVKPTVESLLESPDISNEISNHPSSTIAKILEADFGSIIEFKTLLLNSAHAINGDGFTWVVARLQNHTSALSTSDNLTFDKLFILNTYNAGSPKNSNKTNILKDLEKLLQNQGSEKGHLYSSSIPAFEEAEDLQSFNKNVTYKPILAIDASPKSWLHDYGVFGKRQYLEQIWKAIDWEIVTNRLPDSEQKAV